MLQDVQGNVPGDRLDNGQFTLQASWDWVHTIAEDVGH